MCSAVKTFSTVQNEFDFYVMKNKRVEAVKAYV